MLGWDLNVCMTVVYITVNLVDLSFSATILIDCSFTVRFDLIDLSFSSTILIDSS